MQSQKLTSEVYHSVKPIIKALGLNLFNYPGSCAVESVFDKVLRNPFFGFYRKLAIYSLLYWEGTQGEIDSVIFLLERDEQDSLVLKLLKKDNQEVIQIMQEMSDISLETEARVYAFSAQIQGLSRLDLIELCSTINYQMVHQESLYKKLIKTEWGI